MLVEQAGQSDKVLIDQVTDTDTGFDEVSVVLLMDVDSYIVYICTIFSGT